MIDEKKTCHKSWVSIGGAAILNQGRSEAVTFEQSVKVRRESWRYMKVSIPDREYKKDRGPDVDTCLACPLMVQSQCGWSGTRRKEGEAGAGQRDMQSQVT